MSWEARGFSANGATTADCCLCCCHSDYLSVNPSLSPFSQFSTTTNRNLYFVHVQTNKGTECVKVSSESNRKMTTRRREYTDSVFCHFSGSIIRIEPLERRTDYISEGDRIENQRKYYLFFSRSHLSKYFLPKKWFMVSEASSSFSCGT